MILAIDIGNTNIVIGCCADGQVIFRERVSTNPTATVLEYAAMLKMAFDMNRADITAVDGAILSSVVPAVTLTMRDAVHKYLHLTPLVVGPGIKTGLRIHIDNPAQLGSDLVVDAVAWAPSLSPPADHHRYGYRHHRLRSGCGGRIPRRHDSAGCGRLARCPRKPHRAAAEGRVRAAEAHHRHKFRRLPQKRPALTATPAALDGLIDRINAELNTSCTVVATGGLSSVIAPLCRNKIILDDDLLLKGLSILFEKNKPKN